MNKLSGFLLIGLIAGFFIGGYVVLQLIPLKSEGSIAIVALATLGTTIFGGFLGAFIAFHFDKESAEPNNESDESQREETQRNAEGSD